MESWTEELEDNFIELRQQNECLYDISCKSKRDLELRKLQRNLTLPVRTYVTIAYGCLASAG